jgi:hypothetical protein
MKLKLNLTYFLKMDNHGKSDYNTSSSCQVLGQVACYTVSYLLWDLEASEEGARSVGARVAPF